MRSKALLAEKLEDLIHKAREGWASGSIASDSDFEFIEETWRTYHLDSALSKSQIRRLEEIVLLLKGTLGASVTRHSGAITGTLVSAGKND